MKRMYRLFERYSKNNTLLSILMALLGLVLLIWPGGTLRLAARALGIGLLAGAAVQGLIWYKDRKKPGVDFGHLALAVLCGILGIVVLSAPEGVVSLLPKLIGIAILVNGAINLAQAFALQGAGHRGWTPSLVMALLTVGLGIFLLVFPFTVMKAAVMVIGGVFLYNGVSNLWIESRYKKLGR